MLGPDPATSGESGEKPLLCRTCNPARAGKPGCPNPILVHEHGKMPNLRFSVSDKLSPEVSRIRNMLDACSCAERDKENRIINPELRREEEKLDETLPRFVSEHAEEIIQCAAPAQVSHVEVKGISGRVEGLEAHVAAELLFAVLENQDSFAALTKSAFTDSLARLDDDVASAQLYEVRLTQNAEALTDRRLFSDDAVSFFNAAGKESASEVYNSIGRTGNVGSIEGMFNASVLEIIGGDAKVAAELSYALGSTGSDAVLSSEVMDARKTMSAGLFANVLSAMWMTRKPEAFSDAETLDKIGKGKLELWEYAANLVSGRESKTVVVAKLGDDEHDRGAKSVVQSLSDAGFRVIYLGNAETHGEVVGAALRYGAEAVGFSFSEDSQQQIAVNVISSMRSAGDHVSFFGGGAVTPYAVRGLENAGLRFFNSASPFNETMGILALLETQHTFASMPATSTEFNSNTFVAGHVTGAFSNTSFDASPIEIVLKQLGLPSGTKLPSSNILLDIQAPEELQGIIIGPYSQVDLGNGVIAVNPTGVPIPLSKAIIILRQPPIKKEAKTAAAQPFAASRTAAAPPPLRYPKATVSDTVMAHASNPEQVRLIVEEIFYNEAREHVLSSTRREAEAAPAKERTIDHERRQLYIKLIFKYGERYNSLGDKMVVRSLARNAAEGGEKKAEAKIGEEVAKVLLSFDSTMQHISEGAPVSKAEQERKMSAARERLKDANEIEGEKREETGQKLAEINEKSRTLLIKKNEAETRLSSQQAETESAMQEYGDYQQIAKMPKDEYARTLDGLLADVKQTKVQIKARTQELRSEAESEVRGRQPVAGGAPAQQKKAELTEGQKEEVERLTRERVGADSTIVDFNAKLSYLAEKVDAASARMAESDTELGRRAKKVRDENEKLTAAINAFREAEKAFQTWEDKERPLKESTLDFELKQATDATKAAEVALKKETDRLADLTSGVAVIDGVRGISHAKLIETGDSKAVNSIEEDLVKFNIAAPERFEQAVYDRQRKAANAVNNAFDSNTELGRYLVAMVGDTFHAGEGQQYKNKTSRAWSQDALDRAFARVADALKTGREEQFYSLMKAVKGVNVEKFKTELTEYETNVAILKIYGRTEDIAATGDIGKAKEFLENFKTADDVRKYGIPNTVLLPGVSEMLLEEIKNAKDKKVVEIYHERTRSLIGRIEKMQDKKDKVGIKKTNGTIYQLVAEINAVMEVANPPTEDIGKLTQDLNDIKAAVEAKAKQLGIKSTTSQVSSAHMSKVAEHVRTLISTSDFVKGEENVLSANTYVTLAVAAYEDIVQIFAKVYGISKLNIEETLDEYVKRQLELKKALRETKLKPAQEMIASATRFEEQ